MRGLFVVFLLCFSSLLYSQSSNLLNGGFEDWDGSGANDEPTSWNGFPSASCDLTGMAALGCGAAKTPRHSRSTEIRPGSTGAYSCKLFATKTWGFIANGVITTGQIRIGSSTATDAQNYNITRTGNSNFNQKITAKPDSIYFWAMFKCPDPAQYARMSAIVHANHDFRDPTTSDPASNSHIVASASKNFQRGDQGWNFYSIPFSYDGPSDDPRHILLTFTTNKEPGQGSDQDVLFLDDIELIYNPRLNLLAVDGESLDGFSPEKLEYSIYVSEGADNLVSAEPQSINAHVDIQQANGGSYSFVNVTAGDKERQYKIEFIYLDEFEAEICQGSSYNSNGFDIPVQDKTGIFNFEDTYEDSNGVKHSKKLKLIVYPTYTDDFVDIPITLIQVPQGSTYDFFGNLLSESGVYEKTLQTVNSCDSVVKIDLVFSESYLINISASICDGQVYSENGFNEMLAGEYTQNLTSIDNGCDSIVVLNLTVNPSFSVENPILIYDTLTVGNKYDRNGFIYPVSKFENIKEQIIFMDTVYSTVFLTACDSVTVLNLTIFPKPVKEEDVEPEDVPSTSDKQFSIYYSMDGSSIILKTNKEFQANEKYRYFIYDFSGKRVRIGDINEDTIVIYKDEFFSGLYVIKIFGKNKKSSGQTLKFCIY